MLVCFQRFEIWRDLVMADKYVGGLYCFLGGLGMGLAAGILFAPYSGAGTRDRFRRKAGEARDLVNAKADEGREFLKRQAARLVDQTSEFVEHSKRVVNEQKQRVASAVQAGTTAYRNGM
jgi:gas vesicle protein